MKCNICQSVSQELFKATVLYKYSVQYYKCTNCKFIQTEEPYWLNEAYKSAIATADVGLVYRNILFSNTAEDLIIKHFNYKSKFLDYAGGYGLFVRIMRDKGFDFYRQDPYCENLFAQYIDVVDLPPNTKFEMATAFEVFEHWTDPILELQKVLDYSDSVLFSTEIQPVQDFGSSDDWSYFIPETGQHVSFYTIESLKILSAKYELNFYTNEKDLHLFTPKKLLANPLEQKIVVVQKPPKPESYTQKVVKKTFRRIFGIKPPEPKIKLESLLLLDFNTAIKRLDRKV